MTIWRSAPLVVFAVAAVTRVAALLYFPPPQPNYYWLLSENLLEHHTFALEGGPTTYIEPLYPAFLAAARLVAGGVPWLALLVQVAVASAGAVLLFHLTRSVTGSARAALAAGLLYAIDPYFARQSVAYLELPLLLTLLLWTLLRFFSTRSAGGAAWTGVLAGALLLTRASLLPVCAAVVVMMGARHGWKRAALCVLVAALVVAPWAIRNHALDGSVLPPRLGENLFVSTSAYAVGVLPEHDVDLLVPFAHALVDRELGHVPPSQLDAPADALLLSRALEFARTHPRETLVLKIRNLFYVFWPGLIPVEAKSPDTRAVLVDSRVRIVGALPRPRAWERTHFLFRSVLLVAAVAGIAARRRLWRDDALLYLVLLSTIAVHVLFFPTTRLLAPMTAVLMVYAGLAFARVWTRIAPPGVRPA